MSVRLRLMGEPRGFWNNRNTTIINNNYYGFMPIRHNFCRPMPIFGHNCYNGGNMVNWMLGFGLASSFMNNLFGNTQQNTNYYNSYSTYPQTYYPNNLNTNQYIENLTSKIEKLEDDLSICKKEIDSIKQNNENSNNKEININSNPTDEKILEKSKNNNETVKTQEKNTEKSTNTEQAKKTEQATKPEKTQEQKEETPKTLDEILNENNDFKALDNNAKSYVKSKISQVYIDENGNIKYDIKAIVHDGDNLNTIINRFYTEEEKNNLEIAKAKLHTQGSETNIILNPLSGDTITANGVSEYGLKALMQDAKNGITKQGEITKTNKRISDLKTSFINGEKKLSKAYVLQNKLMSEAQYNKIIQEKYS